MRLATARARADRARQRRRRGPGARPRGRRLPGQAVRLCGAARTVAGADPAPQPCRPRRRADRRRPRVRSHRPDRESWRPPAGLVGHRARPAGVLHARARPGAQPAAAVGARLGSLVPAGLQRGGRVHRLPTRQGGPAVRPAQSADGARAGVPTGAGACVRAAPVRLIHRVHPLSLRLRLTAVFAVAMAVVLAALAGFLHGWLATELQREIDRSLGAHADTLLANASAPDVTSSVRFVDPDEAFAQLLTPAGRV